MEENVTSAFRRRNIYETIETGWRDVNRSRALYANTYGSSDIKAWKGNINDPGIVYVLCECFRQSSGYLSSRLKRVGFFVISSIMHCAMVKQLSAVDDTSLSCLSTPLRPLATVKLKGNDFRVRIYVCNTPYAQNWFPRIITVC